MRPAGNTAGQIRIAQTPTGSVKNTNQTDGVSLGFANINAESVAPVQSVSN